MWLCFLFYIFSNISNDEFDPTIVQLLMHGIGISYKDYISNVLDNTSYDMHSWIKSAKTLWKALDQKYKTKDVGMKKFIVDKFLNFKMIDSKTVICQVQEFELILHDIHVKWMVFNESFGVAIIIERFPPS